MGLVLKVEFLFFYFFWVWGLDIAVRVYLSEYVFVGFEFYHDNVGAVCLLWFGHGFRVPKMGFLG